MLSKTEIFVKRNFYLLVSFTAVAPLFSIKLSSLSIGLIFLFWLMFTAKNEKKKGLNKNKRLLTIFFAFFFVFAISLIYSSNLHEGFKDIESKLSLLLIPLPFLLKEKFTKTEFKRIMILIASFTGAFCLTAVALSILNHGTLLTNQELAVLVNMHASYLSLYVAICLFFFADNLLNKNRQVIYVIAGSLFLVLLLLLAARMVIISVLISFLVWFISFQFSWKKLFLLFVFSSLISLGLMQIPSISNRFAEVVNNETVQYGNSAEGESPKNYGGRAIRAAIWDCSMLVVKENWLIGVGAGDVHQNLQAAYKEKEFELAWKYNNYNSHNLFLETIIAVGLSGVILLILLFLFLFKRAIGKKSFMMLSFSILFLCFSMVEATFNVQRGIVFFILFATLLYNSEDSFKIKQKVAYSKR